MAAFHGSRAAAGPQKNGGRTAARAPEIMHMKHNTIAHLRQPGSPAPVPKTTTEVVTPAAARHLRDTAHFSRQRKISPANVQRLADEMKAGRFTPGTQVYVCVLPNGQQLVVNGNHTLEAVAMSGLPQILSVTRHPVADEDEAGRIYAVFDIQKTRSWADSLRAVGTGEDVPSPDNLLAAIGVIERDFGNRSIPPASRLGRIDRMAEYIEPMRMWDAAVKGCPRHTLLLLKRAGVLAVAIETFRYQPMMATDFWGAAAHDDGLANGRPEKALLNWLRNVRNSGGGAAQKEHCRAAAAAWNAAFKGESRTYVKPNLMSVFFLLGTPYAGGLRG